MTPNNFLVINKNFKEKRELATFRLILFLSGLLIPWMAIIFYLGEIPNYPYRTNLIYTVVAFVLYGASFISSFARRQIYPLLVLFIYSILSWGIYLLVTSDFRIEYSILCLTGFLSYAVVLKTFREVLYLGGVFIISILVANFVVLEPQMNPYFMLFGVIALITAAYISSYFRDKAQEDLERNEETIRQLFNQVNEAWVIVSKNNYQIQDVNNTAKRIFPKWFQDKSGYAKSLVEILEGVKDLDIKDIIEAVNTEKRWSKEVKIEGDWYLLTAKNATLQGTDYCVLSFSDINPLKEASLLIENKNLELEQFALATSHDLQEPIRTIKNFVNLLFNEESRSFTEKEQLYADLISGSTIRLERLVRDLLEYSRLGSKNLDFESISIEEILSNVQDDLGLNIKETKTELTITGESQITGVRSLVYTLFLNLLGNAIKFRKPGVTPQIKVQTNIVNGYVVVRIRDNGIGIKEKSHKEVFKIFQRLHPVEEFEGTGIGLTVCQKIMAIHNGSIQIEESSSEGTTFMLKFQKN